jgi:protease IV
MLKRLWGFVKFSLIMVGISTLFLWASLFYMVSKVKPNPPTLADNSILYVDLRKPVTAHPATDPLAALFGEDTIDIYTLTERIRRAGEEPKIKGLIANISSTNLSPAYIEEIQYALKNFKATGKFTMAFSDTFAEGGNGMLNYYLAMGFDQIWMQPTGEMELLGVNIEVPFFKNVLTNIGIEPDFYRRDSYKTALNQLNEDSLTSEHREELTALGQGMLLNVAEYMKANRTQVKIPLQSLMEQAFFTSNTALEAGLIDKIGYLDEMEKAALELANTDNLEHLVTLDDFAATTRGQLDKIFKDEDKSKALALVFAVGPIMRGDRELLANPDYNTVYADSLARDLRDALEDERIAAVVLRIDSPGGSYTASDTVRRVLMQFKAAKKPLIISMGEVAASGGYYIAMDGDMVFANPSTITGSIGVFGGKFVVKPLVDKLGITFDSVQMGPLADQWSPIKKFSGAGLAAFQNQLNAVYDDFTTKVAESRNIEITKMPSIAGGRIYLGQPAQDVQLVDHLGGLRQAIIAAKEQIGFAADQPLPLIIYPKFDGDFSGLFKILNQDSMVFSWLPKGLLSYGRAVFGNDGAQALAPYVVVQ